MAIGIFYKIKQLASKVGKGQQWVNDKVVKPVVHPTMKQFSGIIPGGRLIRKGIETGSSALDAFYGQAKAIQVQGLNTIESQLESNAVTSFKNDGEHHYSIKEIRPESQMPALFDKEIIISLSFNHGFAYLGQFSNIYP
ncbi:MAG: hypothetical protein EZS28_053767 [Streblomastix strix]|uniref:Uncharacterized protein n=1 Tax=Streblomastix strix TaxID=222440 RepID=A0A5J4R1G8_9EUKA|nr:MAG: hypothetical protein EZS28_053767 [Streblomastix strix]